MSGVRKALEWVAAWLIIGFLVVLFLGVCSGMSSDYEPGHKPACAIGEDMPCGP
jgi:hypothetical protein